MSSNEGKSWLQLLLGGADTNARWDQLKDSFPQHYYSVRAARDALEERGLQISEEQLRRWIRNGKVSVRKPSPRKTIIHRDELIRVLMRGGGA